MLPLDFLIDLLLFPRLLANPLPIQRPVAQLSSIFFTHPCHTCVDLSEERRSHPCLLYWCLILPLQMQCCAVSQPSVILSQVSAYHHTSQCTKQKPDLIWKKSFSLSGRQGRVDSFYSKNMSIIKCINYFLYERLVFKKNLYYASWCGVYVLHLYSSMSFSYLISITKNEERRRK